MPFAPPVPPHSPVLSTYRLQLRGPAPDQPGFTFAAAESLIDYLVDLGVSHLYLSPVLTAAPGSAHGYNVTDPTTVSAALGGPEGLAALSEAARRRGLGLVVDIVPNHLGVDPPADNAWWWDVLRFGLDSRYAPFFDVDWSADPQGRIILPMLGAAEDIDRLELDGDVLRIYGMELPLAPGTAEDGACATTVHDRQHYRLVDWRTGVCGYRRFFAITSLAGIRQEDPEVFATTHGEVARWFAEGLVDGVRIDHPDGLTDPTGYLIGLRDLVGAQAWIVIEKILAPGEPLDPALPVNGTTGYDVLREVGGVFIDPTGQETLSALAQDPEAEPLRQLKIRTATDLLGSEMSRLCRTVENATDTTHPLLSTAASALLSNIGVYRCDYPALSQLLGAAIAATVAAEPKLADPLTMIAAALTHPEPAARFQQMCGAMTAKAVEDCHFYRDARLVSLNEVGGAPDRFGVSLAEFHRSAAVRAEMWPHTMTALSTHDTKRGEDVRARIGVLSQVPGLWAQLVTRLEEAAPSPDRQTGLFLWQNLFGVWPEGGRVDDALRERLHGYAEKAAREAGRRTSWKDPDSGFESELHTWLDAVLDGQAGAALTELVNELLPHGRSDALGQKLLALTVPGVPDVYQGTEVWEDSLVDPDNRRPVDFGALREDRQRLEHPKMRVVTAALTARRDRPDTFLHGGYRPVLACGAAADHVLAFLRGDDVLVSVTRWTVRLSETGWGATAIELPPGNWTDRMTGARHTGRAAAAELFADLPVALLERVDG